MPNERMYRQHCHHKTRLPAGFHTPAVLPQVDITDTSINMLGLPSFALPGLGAGAGAATGLQAGGIKDDRTHEF